MPVRTIAQTDVIAPVALHIDAVGHRRTCRTAHQVILAGTHVLGRRTHLSHSFLPQVGGQHSRYRQTDTAHGTAFDIGTHGDVTEVCCAVACHIAHLATQHRSGDLRLAHAVDEDLDANTSLLHTYAVPLLRVEIPRQIATLMQSLFAFNMNGNL